MIFLRGGGAKFKVPPLVLNSVIVQNRSARIRICAVKSIMCHYSVIRGIFVSLHAYTAGVKAARIDC